MAFLGGSISVRTDNFTHHARRIWNARPGIPLYPLLIGWSLFPAFPIVRGTINIRYTSNIYAFSAPLYYFLNLLGLT